jgi:hypothetical protein
MGGGTTWMSGRVIEAPKTLVVLSINTVNASRLTGGTVNLLAASSRDEGNADTHAAARNERRVSSTTSSHKVATLRLTACEGS